jgi:type III pantothenate kinase
MNLIIDQGNTFTKIGVFEQDNSIEEFSIPANEIENKLNELFSAYPIENSILSSVIHTSPKTIDLLRSKSKKFIELNENTPIPIKNCYETPSTLGKDRIAVAVAANYLKPNTNNFVIDAGTTITYEFINAKGEYLGGNISPGMRMRFSSLHAFTKKLPLIEPAEKVDFLGNNTQSAILSGVINGITFEMNSYINILKEKYIDLTIFLTGGDTFFFESTLKSRTFACKNLLLVGLNRILNYNV